MDTLSRALSQVGKLVYKLGKGGYNPLSEYAAPLTFGLAKGKLLPVRARFCDCSGFVAWCLGRSRKPDAKFRWWLSTDSIYHDAKHGQNLFVEIPKTEAKAGDLLVYPDYLDAKGVARQGHVAFIVDPLTRELIDCSSTYGCSRRDGRGMFLRATSIAVRYVP